MEPEHTTSGDAIVETGPADASAIRIRGARQNNLRDLTIDIPLARLTVVTGVSGSGKSSLAFDTLYAEGQRLYVSTFSPYTRQFLDRMDRPAVDDVDGIPPAIAIDQTNPVRTSRSTVGTMTELNDHFKLLFARTARLHCRSCRRPVTRDTPETVIADLNRAMGKDPHRIVVTFPVNVAPKLERDAVEDLVKRQGYRGVHWREDDTCHVIQDRLRYPGAEQARLVEDIEQAMDHGRGRVSLWIDPGEDDPGQERRYSSGLHCAVCDIPYRDAVPNLFSFNSPLGACETCRGFGRIIGIDYGLVIPDGSRTLREGAIRPWQSESYAECQRDLVRFASERGIRLNTAWDNLSDAERSWVIEGEGDWDQDQWYGISRFFTWLEGRSYRMHVRVLLSRYRSYTPCPACGGARLKPEALLWRIGPDTGVTIRDLMEMPISELSEFFHARWITETADTAALTVTAEIQRRLTYLVEVGLGYLNLDRQSRTLSGGEVQRVNLTTALGTSLVNTLFVLDEPSIGLHPRDVDRLIGVLHRLRDAGNTIVIVEHDPELIRAADFVIDLGPGPGTDGGRLVYAGSAPGILSAPGSLTGQYLSGSLTVDTGFPAAAGLNPNKRGGALTIRGAREHNLADITVEIPLGTICAVTGVSGSGKSTLVEDVLYRAMLRHLGKQTEQPGDHDGISMTLRVDEVVLVDQSPIGKSARSNPASYVGAFSAIRALFAAQPTSKELGFTAGSFSFNSPKGQCPACKGSGFEHIEMQFLSDVYLRCPDCGGRRFRKEVLAVSIPIFEDDHNGVDSPPDRLLTIADVLELTVDEAVERFGNHRKIVRGLAPLQEIGLGYLRLGQPVPTLSGGEAQRLKLASHLIDARRSTSHTLFLFDEPTTGLHFADISRLLSSFRALRDAGNSVVVIEHNLDLIAAADWVVDLGPEGGAAGGRVVYTGTPEGLATAGTHTGRQLRDVTERGPGCPTSPGTADQRASPIRAIEICGAREHNLRRIDVEIPYEKLTVLTGVSGSGKSTIAFDIVFAEGQRRYLESLNAYARQFVQPATRAEFDRAAGIPPTVAIEQRTSRGGQKSTVATTTEIYQFLRLLFARLGTRYCPDCNLPIEGRSEEAIRSAIQTGYADTSIYLLAPLVSGRKGYYTDLAKWAVKHGHAHLRVDGRMVATATWPRLERYRDHDIELPVGPIKVGAEPDELTSGLREALAAGHGVVYVTTADGGAPATYSTLNTCPTCGRSFDELDPRLFSFNSRYGWCPGCLGTGVMIGKGERQAIADDASWDAVSSGTHVCTECAGTRLRPEARWVHFHGRTLPEVVSLPVTGALEFIRSLTLEDREVRIASDLLREVADRLAFLTEVGLGYLTLDRPAPSLSGGEAQRIRLAAQLGSHLRGVCYVLDEPTIGLHPRDNRMLLSVLGRLTRKGNTVLVVEHDEETIRAADYIVDLGPGGGVRGGEVIGAGTLEDIIGNPASVTGRYLLRSAEPRRVHAERHPDRPPGGDITVRGAWMHNLKNLDVDIPLGKLVCISGVSGSGKSTLVRDVLYESLRGGTPVGCASIGGVDGVERVLEVDQTPIGKTPRSTPATYIGIWDAVRKLYSNLPEARMRGYAPGRFSFNAAGGRCEECGGQGVRRIEMSFLPNVTVRCAACSGRRYNEETLAVLFKGRSIADVLEMNVDEAAGFFGAQPRIRHPLELLTEVGLGYLTLGQPSPTLSGGEAQRIKLVAELARSMDTARRLTSRIPRDNSTNGWSPRSGRSGSSLFLLDEPTVGLHMADVAQLIGVLRRLVDIGASVVVIEHNLDVIAASDWIIDLGPEGGDAGGTIVVAGTPETVAAQPRSYTAAFLASALR